MMMTGKTPFFARVSYGLSTALLALSLTSGVSAVGAESEDPGLSWRETLVIPIMDALHEVHGRLSSLEANVALFAGSFASQQITTNELCIADSGAQTCITKAQLDALLAMMASVTVKPAPAATDLKQSTAVETEGHTSAAVEPAPVSTAPKDGLAGLETEAKGTNSVESETKTSTRADPVEPDITAVVVPSLAPAVAPEPVAMPEQKALDEQEPAPTGSVLAATSGAAVAWYPEVEISIPAPVPPSSE
jgi:hypothetical protein